MEFDHHDFIADVKYIYIIYRVTTYLKSWVIESGQGSVGNWGSWRISVEGSAFSLLDEVVLVGQLVLAVFKQFCFVSA